MPDATPTSTSPTPADDAAASATAGPKRPARPKKAAKPLRAGNPIRIKFRLEDYDAFHSVLEGEAAKYATVIVGIWPATATEEASRNDALVSGSIALGPAAFKETRTTDFELTPKDGVRSKGRVTVTVDGEGTPSEISAEFVLPHGMAPGEYLAIARYDFATGGPQLRSKIAVER
jgi:hypothetical protein